MVGRSGGVRDAGGKLAAPLHRPGSRVRFFLRVLLLSTLALAAQASPPDRRIAITIDDLPWQRMDKTPAVEVQARQAQLMAQLKQAGVPVVGFVNEAKLEVGGQVAGDAFAQGWHGSGAAVSN